MTKFPQQCDPLLNFLLSLNRNLPFVTPIHDATPALDPLPSATTLSSSLSFFRVAYVPSTSSQASPSPPPPRLLPWRCNGIDRAGEAGGGTLGEMAARPNEAAM